MSMTTGTNDGGLKKIYDKSVKDGYKGSYDDFTTYFNASDENRRRVYDKNVKNGYKGSYDDFISFAGAGQPSSPTDYTSAMWFKQPVGKQESLPIGVAAPKQEPDYSAIMSPQSIAALDTPPMEAYRKRQERKRNEDYARSLGLEKTKEQPQEEPQQGFDKYLTKQEDKRADRQAFEDYTREAVKEANSPAELPSQWDNPFTTQERLDKMKRDAVKGEKIKKHNEALTQLAEQNGINLSNYTNLAEAGEEMRKLYDLTPSGKQDKEALERSVQLAQQDFINDYIKNGTDEELKAWLMAGETAEALRREGDALQREARYFNGTAEQAADLDKRIKDFEKRAERHNALLGKDMTQKFSEAFAPFLEKDEYYQATAEKYNRNLAASTNPLYMKVTEPVRKQMADTWLAELTTELEEGRPNWGNIREFAAAADILKDTRAFRNAANKNGLSTGLRSAYNTLADWGNLTWGVADAVNQATVNDVMKKLDKDGYDNLKPAEQALVDAVAVQDLVQGLYNSDVNQTAWGMGETTAQMAQFIAELYVSSGFASAARGAVKGGIKQGAKQGVKQGFKGIGKGWAEGWRAAQMSRQEAAQLGRMANKYTNKSALEVAKNLGKKTLKVTDTGLNYALTTGAGHSVANTLEYMAPELDFDYDFNTGEATYNGAKGGDRLGIAALKGFGKQAIEGGTEVMGEEFFEPLVERGGAWLMRALGKEGRNAYKPYLRVVDDWVGGGVLKNIQGYGIEYGEELAGSVLRALTGISSWDEEFNKENLAQTAYGLMPAQIGFGMLGLGRIRGHNRRARRARALMEKYAPEQQDFYNRVAEMSTYDGADMLDRRTLDILETIDKKRADGSLTKADEQKAAAELGMIFAMQEQLYMDEAAAYMDDKKQRSIYEGITSNINKDNGKFTVANWTHDGQTERVAVLSTKDGKATIKANGKKHTVDAKDISVQDEYTPEQAVELAAEANEEDWRGMANEDQTTPRAGSIYYDAEGNTPIVPGGGRVMVTEVADNGDVTFETEAGRQQTMSRRQFYDYMRALRENYEDTAGEIEAWQTSETEVANTTAQSDNAMEHQVAGQAARDVERLLAQKIGADQVALLNRMDVEGITRAYLEAEDDTTRSLISAWLQTRTGTDYHNAMAKRKQDAVAGFKQSIGRLAYDNSGITIAEHNGNTVAVESNDGSNAVVVGLDGSKTMVPSASLANMQPSTLDAFAEQAVAPQLQQADALERVYDGTVFNEGQVYDTGVDKDGKPRKVAVVSVNPDGTISYATNYGWNKDGSLKPDSRSVNIVSAEDFRDMIETANEDAVEKAEGERQAAQQRADMGSLKAGQRVVIMDGGKPVGGVVMMPYTGQQAVFTDTQKLVNFDTMDDLKKSMQQAANVQQTETQAAVEAMSNRLNELAGVMPNAQVRVITDKNQLDAGAQELLNQGMTVDAYFNPETNTVDFYVPGMIANGSDADVKFIHEVIIHYGLRNMLGKENYDALCLNIFNSVMTDEQKQKYVQYVKDSHPNSNLTDAQIAVMAADEYLAFTYENRDIDAIERKNILQRIVDAIMQLFQQSGVQMDRAKVEAALDELVAESRDWLRGEEVNRKEQQQQEEKKVEEKKEELPMMTREELVANAVQAAERFAAQGDPNFVKDNLDKAKKRVSNAKKRKPTSTDPAKRQEQINKINEELAAAEAELAFWNDVQGVIEAREEGWVNSMQENEAQMYSVSQNNSNEELQGTGNSTTFAPLNITPDEYTDDFRRVQEESVSLAGEGLSEFNRDEKDLALNVKQGLARVYGRLLARGDGGSDAGRSLTSKYGTEFTLLRVNGSLFHDIFATNRTYLANGELVDLHDNYDNCKCFITNDGLCGFAIEEDGNLVSVFSLWGGDKKGFLYAIKDFVREQGATHLDAYASKKQPLEVIYKKTLGFYVASEMDYNMEFDHDDIAANHGEPKVVFMVDHPVAKKSFDKDSYDEAQAYQLEHVRNGSNDGRNMYSVANANQAIFVSNAARAVEGIKQEKATPEQWLKMIEKNGGLKAGEDKWLGVSQWLKSLRRKTLTKQEVLDFINENAIKIEETHYAEAADELPEGAKERLAQLNNEFSELIFEGDVETESIYTSDWVDYALVAMEERYGEDFRFAFDVEGRGTESRLVPATDFDGEIDDRAKYYLGYEESEENPIESVRLQYTTEGLDNKREIALTVPTIEPWNENDEIHFGDAGEGRAIAWIRFGETTADRELTEEERAEIMPSTDKWEKVDGSNFVNKHDIYYYPGTRNQSYNSFIVDRGDGIFEIQGPILRRITSSRYPSLEDAVNAFNRQYAKDHGLKKERVLVIDEIQSKRHQEGREHGYKIEIEQAQKEWNDFLKRMHEKYEFGETDKFEDVFDKNEMAEVRRLQDQLNQAYFNHGAIPTAPFEKNWMELAMKRMLRLAAEEGYDKVAWTTGEQQAERYNLGKFYDTIGREDKDDNYRRYVLSGNNVDEIVIDEQNRVVESSVSEAEGKPLSEVVGMDMAVKMENMNDGDELSGNELRIGGEGMKGFYDKMIPSFMNKYGKQWGVKVGEVTMPNLEEGYQTMHSIDVNVQMKADVMEGQLMFSLAPAAKERRLLNEEEKAVARERLESTTPIDVEKNQITKEEGKTISATANEWAEKNIPNPIGYDTEAGRVFIDKRSIKDSVSHGVSQAKLDAITSLTDGFLNATYIGSLPDRRGNGIGNHYFAYPINYDGNRNYVFCRAREDDNTHRLYVHEVFLESELKKDARHTAASEKPHGGILLYKNILSDVLNAKVQQNSESATENENNSYSITPQQDADYMDAVNRGDMETAQRMVTEAAKAAMPNTKVVDENGNPLVVYHGTGADFNVFGANDDYNGNSFWLSEDEAYAEEFTQYGGDNPHVVKAYVNITNPIDLRTEPLEGYPVISKDNLGEEGYAAKEDIDRLSDILGITPEEVMEKYDGHNIWSVTQSREFADAAIKRGYDGIKLEEDMEPTWGAFKPSQIKSADPVTYDDQGNVIPLSERFNPNNNDIRYSFIGERGAERMDVKERAMTRVNSLADAKKLEELLGKSEDAARKIKFATGWERGKDGKWRYEIQDIELNDDSDLIKWVEGNGEEPTETTTLDQIINKDSEILKAYPQLASYDVYFVNDADNKYIALFHEGDKDSDPAFIINKAYASDFTKERIRKIMTHELQHAIQAKENFARGGNPKYIAQAVKDMDNNAKIWGYIRELESASEDTGIIGEEELYNEIVNNRLGDNPATLEKEGWIPNEDLRKVAYRAWSEGRDTSNYEKSYEQWYKRLRENGMTFWEADPVTLYRSLAGEVEARNASKRIEMTSDERRQILAAETEDVAREDQLIMMAGDPILYSVAKNTNTPQERMALYDAQVGTKNETSTFVGRTMENAYQYILDGAIPLKRLQTVVAGRNGVKDAENAYLMEIARASRAKYLTDQAEKKYMQPMMDAIADLTGKQNKRGFYKAMRDVELYVLAKSGLERNQWFWDEAKKEDPNAQLEDKSGLTALAAQFGDTDFTAFAQRLVAEYEAKHGQQKIDNLWNAIRNMSHNILDTERDGMLISAELCEDLKNRWQYYVPMRGFDEDVTSSVYSYDPSSANIRFENPFKKIKGRVSLADNPFVNLWRMTESAINLKGKNEVGLALLTLASNHPDNGLLRVGKSWETRFIDPNTGEEKWMMAYPNLANVNQKDIPAAIDAFQKSMARMAKNGDARQSNSRTAGGMRVFPTDMDQHTLKVTVAGQSVDLYLMGNPKAFQALNPKGKNRMAQAMSALTRGLSGLMTTYNPVFMVRNSMRDLGTAMFITYTRDGVGGMATMLGQWFGNANRLRRLISGKSSGDATIDQYWNEFLEFGGETGFTRSLAMEKARDEFMKDMRNATRKGINTNLVFHAYGNWMENYGNRFAEDITRFAVFCASRKQGKSAMQAAADAKNTTANFNKKGNSAFTRFMTSNFAFFNAALQGLNTTFHAYKDNPGRAAVASVSTMAFSMALPFINMLMLAAWGDDDDWLQYENMTQFIGNTHLVVYIPKTGFVTLPFPQDFVPLTALGNIIWRNAAGFSNIADERSIAGNIMLEWASTMADLLPVNMFEEGLGKIEDWEGVARAIAPTWLSPVADVMLNRNFMGSMIRRKHFLANGQKDLKPYWAEYDRNKSEWAYELAKLIAGGDEYRAAAEWRNIDPRQIIHIVEGYGGGTVKLISDAANYATARAKGENASINQSPFIKKFWIQPQPDKYEGNLNGKLYEMAKHQRDLEQELKDLQKEADKAYDDGNDALAEKREKEIERIENSIEYQVLSAYDVNGMMESWREQRNDITADEELSDEGKQEQIRSLTYEKAAFLDGIWEELFLNGDKSNWFSEFYYDKKKGE